ncbi:unnamed protein product [Bathycoccus prasinos]
MTSNPSFPLLNPTTAKSTIIDARPVSPTTFFEVVVVIEAVDDDAECDDATRESKSAALMSSGAASGAISVSFLLKRDIISRQSKLLRVAAEATFGLAGGSGAAFFGDFGAGIFGAGTSFVGFSSSFSAFFGEGEGGAFGLAGGVAFFASFFGDFGGSDLGVGGAFCAGSSFSSFVSFFVCSSCSSATVADFSICFANSCSPPYADADGLLLDILVFLASSSITKASSKFGNKFANSAGSANASAAFLLILPKSDFHNWTISETLDGAYVRAMKAASGTLPVSTSKSKHASISPNENKQTNATLFLPLALAASASCINCFGFAAAEANKS